VISHRPCCSKYTGEFPFILLMHLTCVHVCNKNSDQTYFKRYFCIHWSLMRKLPLCKGFHRSFGKYFPNPPGIQIQLPSYSLALSFPTYMYLNTNGTKSLLTTVHLTLLAIVEHMGNHIQDLRSHLCPINSVLY